MTEVKDWAQLAPRDKLRESSASGSFDGVIGGCGEPTPGPSEEGNSARVAENSGGCNCALLLPGNVGYRRRFMEQVWSESVTCPVTDFGLCYGR
jgi:hypothetical protein